MAATPLPVDGRSTGRLRCDLPYSSPALSSDKTWRTEFISDTHLGMQACKAETLADFRTSCDTVKNAVDDILRFQEAVAREARADLTASSAATSTQPWEQIGGILCLNDGNWVESCTALVEDAAGNLEILHWPAFGESHETSFATSPGEVAAAA